ncbi:hypothetical protein F383_36954 [Gossypium arboreum]|uniref:Uncharacterized protein n=1 Tax=Gossypium arboreum TaxID=29729 RepID=A0A0B0MEF0_GOSAR|nr:hypothetical protein F383_36954 [Gossypium arboreum]
MHTATRHDHVSRLCSRLTSNCRTTPGDTRLCNMTVCCTRLRHTPLSLPMWTKIGYL